MRKVAIDEYVLKISSATRLQLVIINYELIFEYLQCAKENIKDIDIFSDNIERARKFLSYLISSLDEDYPVYILLFRIYQYVDMQLARCYFSRDLDYIYESEKLLGEVLQSWKQLLNDKTIDDKCIKNERPMENVQQVYAGLTYGKNGELTEYIDSGDSRGFTV